MGFALWEDHLTVKNKLTKAYQCEDCGFVTRFKGNLARHQARKYVEIEEKLSQGLANIITEKNIFRNRIGSILNEKICQKGNQATNRFS